MVMYRFQRFFFFFFNDPAPTEIYPFPLPAAFPIAEVCRRYQVSRKTGYKWLERYELVGPAGLVDRSHRPYSCPHATPAPIVQQILALQRRYRDRKSTRLNSSHLVISYAVFCLKKKK